MRITEYYLKPFASELVSQHNITCDPLTVRFNSQVLPKLRVDLKPVNAPTCDGLDYKVVIYCKEDGRYIPKTTPTSGPECIPTVPFQQSVAKDLDKCYIAYCLYDQKEIGCKLGRDNLYNVIKLQYTEEKTDSDCIANKCELSLDVENYCKKSVPSMHQVQEYKGPSHPTFRPNYDGQRVFNGGSIGDTPKLYISDKGSGVFESRVVITCSSAGQKFDLLSLYQSRTKEKPVLLKIVQYLKDEEGEITLTLHKRVSKNDMGSTMYCVKRKPDNLYYEKKSNVKTFLDGDHNYVNYQPLVTRVTVEPDTDIAEFSRDKPLSLVCSETAPIPGRSLTWYIRDRNTSELEVPDASSQHYNQSINENTLTLLLNGSYDSKTMFCAQDSHLVLEHPSGRRSVVRYGEVATSRNITLKQQKETDLDVAPTGFGTDPGLVCGVVAGIVALLVATAFVAWWLRRRTAGEGGAPEENEYATIAEVTYAELALKDSAGPPKTQDSSPYAQIVGMYNPRK